MSVASVSTNQLDGDKSAQGQFSFAMEPLKGLKSIEPLTKPTLKQVSRRKKKTSLLEKSSIVEALLDEASEETCSKVSTEPKVLTVTEITTQVAMLLEEGIGKVWIEGEISNYRCQASGHHYFTLKDAGAQIACVLFARAAATLKKTSLRDGLAVQLYGEVTVYQPRGQYQLIVRLVQKKGEGLLQARLEALKQKLAAEGLFDTARKRPLPRFPERIGIVTSPTGAALADFLNVLYRRHPGMKVVINPVRVQGQGAAQEIAAAITEFSRNDSVIGPVDVIVITRGGGSLEDLWEFNEEVVARAIATSSLPVVSAIGHEIDFTISDFVADVRVPTPSAAAELLSADRITLLQQCESYLIRIRRETAIAFSQLEERTARSRRSLFFHNPERLFAQLQQTLDRLDESLKTALSFRLQQVHTAAKSLAVRLRASHPEARILRARTELQFLSRQLHDRVNHYHVLKKSQIERLRSSLAALSPQSTLARGFTITRDARGRVMTSVNQVGLGELLQTECADGKIESVVQHVV